MTATKRKASTKAKILPLNKDPADFCQDLIWNDGRTASVIAKAANVSPCTIWRYKNDPPLHGRISTLKKMLKYYGWEVCVKRIRHK